MTIEFKSLTGNSDLLINKSMINENKFKVN